MARPCLGNSTPSVCIERDTAFEEKYPALESGEEAPQFTPTQDTKTRCPLVLHPSPPVLSTPPHANLILIPITGSKAAGHVPNVGPTLCSGDLLMLLSKTPRSKQSSNGSFLETTTWGARLALLTLITLVVAGLCLADGKHKLSKDLDALKGSNSGASVDVIIQFNQTPTEAHHQKVQNKGGVLKTKLDFIKGAHYSVPVESLDALADDPDVVYISPDRRLNGSLDNTAAAVNAKAAWQAGWDGTGIGVAVIDSGITYHSDLYSTGGSGAKLRIIYSQDFVGGGTNDYYGHGEHVAGIIAGSGKDSNYSGYTRHFKGIAPNANLINLRVLDQNGQGTDSGVISAIQVAISVQNKYHIRVMNLSLGRQVFESYTLDPLCQAVEAAWKAGIVVVAAAGNYGRDNSMGTEGYATITSPGNDPYVITVGAMKTEGSTLRSNSLIASYSSKGPTLLDHVVKPDIVAPGNR